MTEARTLSASFSINSYLLTLPQALGGSVSGSGTFDHGSTPTITATPNNGYSFTGWTGEGVTDPNASTTTVSMTEARTLSASFSLSQLSQNLEVSDLGNNWFSSWFGMVYQTQSEWIYHITLGWFFPKTMESSIWLWSENHGWAWTAQEPFSENFLWLESLKEWVYLDLTSTQAPRYYNYQSESWVDW